MALGDGILVVRTIWVSLEEFKRLRDEWTAPEVSGDLYMRATQSTHEALRSMPLAAKTKREDSRPWIRSRADQWKANRKCKR